MGVTTTKTNKPLNPRGNDQSPLAYNRAKLYSGKALDFDGVNDSIDISNFSLNGYTAFSICFYKLTDTTASRWVFGNSDSISDGINVYQNSDGTIRSRINALNFDTTNNHFKTNGFFVFTYNGTQGDWFVNGQSESTATQAAQTLSITSGAKIAVPSYTTGSYYDGQLSGFKIFNTALTAAQVADLYNNPEKVVPTGVDNTALKLWLPMMEGAGTTAYNGAPDALGSNVVTNGTFDTDSDWTKDTGWTIGSGKATRSGASSNSYIGQDFNVVSGTTYILKYDRTYISGGGETNAYSYFEGSSSRITRGLYIGTAQETVTVLDTFTPTFSGNLAFRLYGIGTFEGSIDNIEIKPISGIGTISGATWTHGIGAPVSQTSVIDWNKIQARTNGGTLSEPLIPQGLTAGRDLLGNLFANVRKQGALNLDGNSWAEVHDNASVDLTDAITLEAWVYWDDASNKGIFGRWHSDSSNRNYLFYKNSAATINFYINSSAIASYASLNATKGWTHIVGTYNRTNAVLYIDGVQQAITAHTTAISTGTLPVEIGRNFTTSNQALTAPIAQPRIYNRALTAEEVQRNYNAGKNTYTN